MILSMVPVIAIVVLLSIAAFLKGRIAYWDRRLIEAKSEAIILEGAIAAIKEGELSPEQLRLLRDMVSG